MNNEVYGISVLMSVYKNEQPEHLMESIMSIINQTRKPDEIVIIEDGPLTVQLLRILDLLENKYESLIKRYRLSRNMGLGLALKYGVEKCSYSLIARMDTDDISLPNRLAEQESVFLKDVSLDIVGGQISEFVLNPDNVVSSRNVPLDHKHIINYQRLRSAFNHMTVMYKKSSVIRSGNYEDALYMEDDLLWHNMISSGCNMKNLDSTLCLVRVDNGMYGRRGGLNYFKHYIDARLTMFKRKQISILDFLYTFFIQLIISTIPVSFRKLFFIKFLRKNFIFGENDENIKTL